MRPATCYVRQSEITQLSKVRGFSEVGDCVRPDACAPTVACRFIFFGRQKNSIPWRRAPDKIPDERNSRRYGFFFCLDFSPSRRYAEMAFCTDGRKKTPCRAGPVQKKAKNEVEKNKNFANFVERHLLWSRLIAVYVRPFSN